MIPTLCAPCLHLPPSSGSFAVVERCLYGEDNRMVAVKRISPGTIKFKADLEVIYDECELAYNR